MVGSKTNGLTEDPVRKPMLIAARAAPSGVWANPDARSSARMCGPAVGETGRAKPWKSIQRRSEKSRVGRPGSGRTGPLAAGATPAVPAVGAGAGVGEPPRLPRTSPTAIPAATSPAAARIRTPREKRRPPVIPVS